MHYFLPSVVETIGEITSVLPDRITRFIHPRVRVVRLIAVVYFVFSIGYISPDTISEIAYLVAPVHLYFVTFIGYLTYIARRKVGTYNTRYCTSVPQDVVAFFLEYIGIDGKPIFKHIQVDTCIALFGAFPSNIGVPYTRFPSTGIERVFGSAITTAEIVTSGTIAIVAVAFITIAPSTGQV